MHRFTLLFLSMGLAAVAAACAVDDGRNDNDDGSDALESDLTALELSCKSRLAATTTFEVSPGFGGAVIEGELKVGAMKTLFVCNTTRGDAGASFVASCTERPQNLHPGKWSVRITRSGTSYEGTLDRGADAGAGEKLTCTPPGRGDAGARDGGDAAPAPVPTYAEVGPIINQTCGGCHNGVFNSLAKVKQRKVQMLSVISQGAMPRGNSQWRNGANGQKVLDFLRNSPEL